MKLTWKVAEKPSGRYRAFQQRGWPTADFKGTDFCAVMLRSEDDYVPRRVREGDHKPITIYIAFYEDRPAESKAPGQIFKWRPLKRDAATLEEAKARAEAFLLTIRESWPKELQ